MTETVQVMIEELGDAKDAAVAAFDWKTVQQGAATAVWAGVVAPAGNIGGQYCDDCQVAEIDDDPSHSAGVRSYALSLENARALWVKRRNGGGNASDIGQSRQCSGNRHA